MKISIFKKKILKNGWENNIMQAINSNLDKINGGWKIIVAEQLVQPNFIFIKCNIFSPIIAYHLGCVMTYGVFNGSVPRLFRNLLPNSIPLKMETNLYKVATHVSSELFQESQKWN